MKTLKSLRLRIALLAFGLPAWLLTKGFRTKRPLSGHIPGAGVSYLSDSDRGDSMCKTLKTDIKLFAAAIVAAATVLGANVSLADIVSTLSGVN